MKFDDLLTDCFKNVFVTLERDRREKTSFKGFHCYATLAVNRRFISFVVKRRMRYLQKLDDYQQFINPALKRQKKLSLGLIVQR
ncbi:hypothetical protein L1987_54667 [Smallanthus sonchifolius]|uniref:Uncharacterized protein n=1 Tax=Smallanthus sonchifolius TaxID=185202 RepID=A0ACB9E7M1_9ASTR|nr:hypothetical protein L1987_54667 [Smallanthus sonchifolius]